MFYHQFKDKKRLLSFIYWFYRTHNYFGFSKKEITEMTKDFYHLIITPYTFKDRIIEFDINTNFNICEMEDVMMWDLKRLSKEQKQN